MVVLDYVEGFYNPRRGHFVPGYIASAEYERRWIITDCVA